MKKAEKKQKAEALHQELEESRTVILSGFEGITVAQDFELRRRIAQVGAKYKVVKNSLIERASQGTPLEPAAKELSGTTSLAYTRQDPVALAKVLTAYGRENPLLKFKSGVVEGRVVSMADLNTVANLPAKEELLSKALFLIKAPARNVVHAVAGVGRKLAVVIQQAVKEKKFKGAENGKLPPEATQSGASLRLRSIIDWTFNPVPAHLREARARAFLERLRGSGQRVRDFRNAVLDLADPTSFDGHGTPSVQDLWGATSDAEPDRLNVYYQEQVDKLERDCPTLKAEFSHEFAAG
jgi:large subunit ribosomal protein L10